MAFCIICGNTTWKIITQEAQTEVVCKKLCYFTLTDDQRFPSRLKLFYTFF